MINRPLRLVAGLLIIALQYFQQFPLLYILSAVLIFEALSGWMLTSLVLRLLKSDSYARHQQYLAATASRFRFEAERAAMLIVGISLLMVYVLPAVGLINPDSTLLFALGFFPWAFGIALVATSLVNACPMVVMFKEMGLR